MSYQFHPEAEAEYLEAVAYYEDRQPGLGASYLAEDETALERVCEAPHRFPIDRQPDIRRIRFLPDVFRDCVPHGAEIKYLCFFLSAQKPQHMITSHRDEALKWRSLSN